MGSSPGCARSTLCVPGTGPEDKYPSPDRAQGADPRALPPKGARWGPAGVQKASRKSTANIAKEAPNAQLEVVRQVVGNGRLERVRSRHAEAIKTLIEKGLRFVACENVMWQ